MFINPRPLTVKEYARQLMYQNDASLDGKITVEDSPFAEGLMKKAGKGVTSLDAAGLEKLAAKIAGRDGKVSGKEIMRFERSLLPPMVPPTVNEVVKGAARMLDQNGDNVIDRADSPWAEQFLNSIKRDRISVPTAKQVLARYDVNGDGKFGQGELRRFDGAVFGPIPISVFAGDASASAGAVGG
jgi:hypothetical protein